MNTKHRTRYAKVHAHYRDNHVQKFTFWGEDCDDALCSGLVSICNHRKVKGWPYHITFELNLESDFVEIFIRCNVFRFCIKRGIRFTLRTIANQQEVVGDVEYYCLGNWMSLNREEISAILQMPHTSFKRFKDEDIMSNYWRFVQHNGCVTNASQFISFSILRWVQNENKICLLAKTRREFSTKIFIALSKPTLIDVDFSQLILCSLFKSKTSISIFIYNEA